MLYPLSYEGGLMQASGSRRDAAGGPGGARP